jgi:hypothetical protein
VKFIKFLMGGHSYKSLGTSALTCSLKHKCGDELIGHMYELCRVRYDNTQFKAHLSYFLRKVHQCISMCSVC